MEKFNIIYGGDPNTKIAGSQIFMKEDEESVVDDGKFRFIVNSGDDSSFILPMSSSFGNGTDWLLDIDWGDGTQTIGSTGTDDYSSGTGVTHSYPEANTNYQITLSGGTGFLKQFGFATETNGCNTSANKAKMISLDSPFTSKMFAETIDENTNGLFYSMFYNCTNLTMGAEFNLPQDITTVGWDFCRYMFRNCTNLTMNDTFNLPQSLTSIGESFCDNMFRNCTNLTMNDVFNLPQNITKDDGYFCPSMFYNCTKLTMNEIFKLPQNITSVGDYFCYQMFYACTNLTMNEIFKLPQNITSVGDYFCYQMFYACTNLTMNEVFNLPQDITAIGQGFCNTMFYNCSNLTMNDVFNFPQAITTAGDYFCCAMFYGCTNLTMNSIFQLPRNITSVGTQAFDSMFYNCSNLQMNNIFQIPQVITSGGNYFCYCMFYDCTSITDGVQHFFGDLVLSQSQLNKTGILTECFVNCSSITEECSADTIPQLSIIPSSNNRCFTGSSDVARNYAPTNWGGLGNTKS